MRAGGCPISVTKAGQGGRDNSGFAVEFLSQLENSIQIYDRQPWVLLHSPFSLLFSLFPLPGAWEGLEWEQRTAQHPNHPTQGEFRPQLKHRHQVLILLNSSPKFQQRLKPENLVHGTLGMVLLQKLLSCGVICGFFFLFVASGNSGFAGFRYRIPRFGAFQALKRSNDSNS